MVWEKVNDMAAYIIALKYRFGQPKDARWYNHTYELISVASKITWTISTIFHNNYRKQSFHQEKIYNARPLKNLEKHKRWN
jgi:hypothetical protein